MSEQLNLSDSADLVSPNHAYEDTFMETLQGRRYTQITEYNKEWKLTAMSIEAPNHYVLMIDQIAKETKEQKQNIIASLVTNGERKIQHKVNPDCKDLKKIKDNLVKNNFPLACELYYHCPDDLFGYYVNSKGKGSRVRLNAWVDTQTVYAPLCEIAHFLQLSHSELSAICCAESLLTYEGLPVTARPLFQNDVKLFTDAAQRRIKEVLDKYSENSL